MNTAPGKPGIEPTWAPADKDLIATSLGSSRIWATIGGGVLNEVYWPSTGQPQIEALDFIVARDGKWIDLKTLGNYQITTPKPHILLPTIIHEAEDFSLKIEIMCDDLRDVVLVRFVLDSDAYRLHVLLPPRLGSEGSKNSGWIEGQSFHGEGNGDALSLRADTGFAKQSVGYRGASDGWKDFSRNGSMRWQYDQARQGNIAFTGQLTANEGVIALAFADTCTGAETLARCSLAEGFDAIRERVVTNWENWGSRWEFPRELTDGRRKSVERALAVIKASEDRTFPGAVVASLSIPWGNTRTGQGGYHFVWPRDSVESALAMIAVNHYRDARQLVAYLKATQQPDGHWFQNLYPSGEPFRTGIQLDQVAFPVLLVAKLCELNELAELCDLSDMVRRAIGYLIRSGPVTPEDRWENTEGISIFTLSMMIAAMVGGAEFIEDAVEREYALSYADYLNRQIENWLYVEGAALDLKHGAKGHYIRIASRDMFAGRRNEIPIVHRNGVCLDAADVVSMDFLYLARLGLRHPNDRRVVDTLKASEGELRVDTPSGPSFYRYTSDAYGEHEDGSAFDGEGEGRLWPLLTGERGHLAVQRGEDANVYLDAMCQMTGIGGMLPEQVWDSTAIPEKRLFPGKPTKSAMPLLWASRVREAGDCEHH